MAKERTFRENKKQEEDIFKEIDHEAKEYDINGNLGIMYFQSLKVPKITYFEIMKLFHGGWRCR